jgi:hypothetical protein
MGLILSGIVVWVFLFSYTPVNQAYNSRICFSRYMTLNMWRVMSTNFRVISCIRTPAITIELQDALRSKMGLSQNCFQHKSM